MSLPRHIFPPYIPPLFTVIKENISDRFQNDPVELSDWLRTFSADHPDKMHSMNHHPAWLLLGCMNIICHRMDINPNGNERKFFDWGNLKKLSEFRYYMSAELQVYLTFHIILHCVLGEDKPRNKNSLFTYYNSFRDLVENIEEKVLLYNIIIVLACSLLP
jgi:hypothetical protein